MPILEAGQGFAGCCAGCKRVVRRSGGGFGHLGTELFVALRIPHTCGLLHGENGKKENGKYFRAPLFKRKLTIPQILREIKNNVKTKDAKKIAAFSRICIRSTTLDPLNLRQGPNIQYGEERHHHESCFVSLECIVEPNTLTLSFCCSFYFCIKFPLPPCQFPAYVK